MGLANEPRTKDDVGMPLDDGLEELGILLRLIFKIGVLDDDDIAGRMPKPGAESRAFALVDLVEDDGQVGLALCHHAVQLTAAVVEVIVDLYDLLVNRNA